MLRALSVAAPVVASIMIVVLLVEPPALRPAERLPMLRVFTDRARAGLDRTQIQAAIAWGQAGAPGPYLLHRVRSADTPRPEAEPAGVVYTPFLRIAWAAHARQASGVPLAVDEVPAWMAAPVFYVALRAPSAVQVGALGPPSIVVVPPDTATCCLESQPTVARPVWISDDSAVTARFGATLPFSDLGVIAAYPIAVLRAGLDFVAFRRIDGSDGPSSVEMRGRPLPSDLAEWR